MSPLLNRIALTPVALLAGGWMLFDGIHVILRGKYFGPEKPGPWSGMFVSLGINPFRLGPMFIGFGVAWLVCLMAIWLGLPWGRTVGILIAVATLWYLPLGTVLSVIYIALLWSLRN